ncbi:MAG: apolipoprotein N-acyltransferase [Planctomycetota bacterium]
MSAANRLAVFAQSTLLPALVSSVVCWLAFPPVGWGWLIWIAPLGWLAAVQREQLPGSRPYQKLWLAGFTFWLLAAHWIRLPHPANHIAWVVLASYLGIYLPTFVALARVGVHRLKLPLWLIAPVIWTGLDWLRHHLMTGFGFGSLAHAQADYLPVIQIASVAGEYAVTFLIVTVASCLLQFLVHCKATFQSSDVALVAAVRPLAPAIVIVAGTVGYGVANLKSEYTPTNGQGLRVALIQGNTLADWKGDETKQRQIMEEYMRLSLGAVKQSQDRDGRQVDLIIWPETTFRQTLATVADGYLPPPDLVHGSYLVAGQRDLAEFVRLTGAAILTGIDRVHLYPTDHGHPDFNAFNSSVLMDSRQQIVGTYDKMHRVPFGEYIPFADWIPALYQLTPLTGGVYAGQQPTLFEFAGTFIAPNICYETCVPHLIRNHVQYDGSAHPDVLVNLTNDAWYWGSSELDMHLACGVFRVVENGRPLLIAANGGLSAHVDASGRVQQTTQRQSSEFLLVDLPTPTRAELTFYTQWGDWFAISCVVCCVVLAVVGWRQRGTRAGGAA